MARITNIILSAAGALALAAGAYGAYVEKTLTYSTDDFNFTQEVGDDEVTYDVVRYKGVNGTTHPTPGEPQLPLLGYSFSIPFGATVDAVEITASDSEIIEGTYYIYPAQMPRRAADGEEWEWTPPNEAIYTSSTPFPAAILVDRGAGPTRGYLLADLVLYPFQYIPSERKLKLYTSITVKVTYTAADPPPEATRFEWPDIYDMWGDEVKETVLNPEDVMTNREPVHFADPSEGFPDPDALNLDPLVYPPDYRYPYLIITNDKWVKPAGFVLQPGLRGALDELRYWRYDQGFPPAVATVEYIDGLITTGDIQEKIRTYIKEAKDNWGTFAVLLAGDTAQPTTEDYSAEWGRYGVVPSRYVTAYSPPDYIHASDFYYACADGSWGPVYYDGQPYYGMPDTPDLKLKPQVIVGRLPVGDVDGAGAQVTETENFVNKLLIYEYRPPTGYLKDTILIGADQGVPDCLDLANSGTLADFDESHLYEGVGPDDPVGWFALFPTYPEVHDILDALNAGVGVTFIACHGQVYDQSTLTHGAAGPTGYRIQWWATRKDFPMPSFSHNLVMPAGQNDLSNGNKYGILYTISCTTFSYDLKDAEYLESMGEEYLADEDGGGIAYLGNTSSGSWGVSEDLAEKFFARVNRHNINGGKDAHFIGLAHAFARGEYCGGEPRHVAYTCNIAGDPLTAFWTAEPAELAMSYQSWPEGTGYTVDVTVTEGANAVPGARVTLEYIPGRYYAWEPTTEDGHALFYNVPVITAGKLTAWKHNYLPKVNENVNVPGE